MSESKPMFRWGLWKKDANSETRRREPQPEPTGDWQFLREQPDHDESTMATVRSRDGGAHEPSLIADPTPVAGTSHGSRPLPTAPARRQVSARLSLEVLGSEEPRRVSVCGAALLGRGAPETGGLSDLRWGAPELDLQDDDAVSRRHARIEYRNGRFWLVDLDSTNGTVHNGRSLIAHVEVPLEVGDEIELGEFTLIRVVALDDEGALTAEDHELSDLLCNLMDDGLAPVRCAAVSDYEISDYRSMNESLDLLDLALELGEAEGLLVPATAGACAVAPSAGGWRLHDPRGAELPLL